MWVNKTMSLNTYILMLETKYLENAQACRIKPKGKTAGSSCKSQKFTINYRRTLILVVQ